MGRLFITFVFASFLMSCSSDAVYEKNKSIPNLEWKYENIVFFDVLEIDSSAMYDIFVNVRHNSSYNFSNIFLKIHEQHIGGIDTAERIEIKLAELDGKWIGKNAGRLFERQMLYKESFTFSDTGAFRFGIEQNMRQNPLMHISDVGIKLVKK